MSLIDFNSKYGRNCLNLAYSELTIANTVSQACIARHDVDNMPVDALGR